MEKGKSKTLLNMVAEELRENAFFKKVTANLDGTAFANATDMPQAVVALRPGTLEPHTAEEYEIHLNVAVIGLCHADKDLELAKCDVKDALLESLHTLNGKDEFRTIGIELVPFNYDASVMSLHEILVEGAILPPFGAVRIDVRVDYRYSIA